MHVPHLTPPGTTMPVVSYGPLIYYISAYRGLHEGYTEYDPSRLTNIDQPKNFDTHPFFLLLLFNRDSLRYKNTLVFFFPVLSQFYYKVLRNWRFNQFLKCQKSFWAFFFRTFILHVIRPVVLIVRIWIEDRSWVPTSLLKLFFFLLLSQVWVGRK